MVESILNGLNPLTRELVGNYNALSADQLAAWLDEGQIVRDDLTRVLSRQMLSDFEHRPEPLTLSPGKSREEHAEVSSEYTEVYFWGRQGSGKSTVIGSIIAAQPESVVHENTGEALNRAQQLSLCFRPGDHLVALPTESEDKASRRTNVTCLELKSKQNWLHSKYPVCLIEATAQGSQIDLESTGLTSSTREQVHILCWDSSYEKGEEQEKMFLQLLSQLRKCKALEHTVGIYLLVTKVDALMALDRKYREQMAQQIITAEHVRLWAEVKNLCWDMDIHDATPIPYSIGEVFLQQLVRVDLQHANRLIEGPLVLKCQPKRSTFENVLMMGSLWISILLIVAMTCGVGFGMYRAFSTISEPPSEVLAVPDYRQWFEEQVETTVSNRTFSEANPQYRRLRNSLKTERSILTIEGDLLLPDSVWTPCQRLLMQSFAPILHQRNRAEMDKSNWDDYGRYLKGINDEILRSPLLATRDRNHLVADMQIFDEYNLACRRIGLSNRCQSMADVDSVYEATSLIKEPLTNNDHVREGLQTCYTNAKLSYANHLSERVNLFIESRSQCEKLRSQLYELRNRTTSEEPAREVIDRALRKIDDRYYSSNTNTYDIERKVRNAWGRMKRSLGI